MFYTFNVKENVGMEDNICVNFGSNKNSEDLKNRIKEF